jgi:transglutaminase-like putative cysteine protease
MSVVPPEGLRVKPLADAVNVKRYTFGVNIPVSPEVVAAVITKGICCDKTHLAYYMLF